MNYEKITKELKTIDPYLFAEKIPEFLSGDVDIGGVKCTVSYRKPGIRITRKSQIWQGMGWTIYDFPAGTGIDAIKEKIRRLDLSKIGLLGEQKLAEERRKRMVAQRRREYADQASKDIYNSLNQTHYY